MHTCEVANADGCKPEGGGGMRYLNNFIKGEKSKKKFVGILNSCLKIFGGGGGAFRVCIFRSFSD